ncbi:MAG: M48 family peptidase, partial [Xanthomonadaceae bacterium]|nr:M48 family peptidase [Xanthomonadaceae bacterium]
MAATVAGCATTTSSTGRKQYVGAVSQQQLDQLGAQAFDQTKAQKPLTQDGRQSAYVRCVVDAIGAQLPEGQRRAWEEAV